MEIYEIEDLYERGKEHLLMQMYMHKDDVDFIETVRPNMKLRNNDGVKFKITTTRNHRCIIVLITKECICGGGFQLTCKHQQLSQTFVKG